MGLFGWSVAVSGDTLVVGSPFESSSAIGVNGNQTDNSTSASGAVYAFVRNGTTWSQQAYLKASNTETNDMFGYDVAVSGDTLVAGAPSEDSNATGVNGNQADNSTENSGAAYVFVRNGTTWSQQAYLKASNTGASDAFGISVAVSSETVIVGSEARGNFGAAYVFVLNGGTWCQQAYIQSGSRDYFSDSVAIDGDTAVVGAFGDSGSATAPYSGAAYVFDVPCLQTIEIADAAPLTLTLGGLIQTYNGFPKQPTATTTPAGLNVTFTFDGSAVAPTNPGSYAVVASAYANNTNEIVASVSGTFVINSGVANVVISNVSAAQRLGTRMIDIDYDVTALSSPVGVSLEISADGGITWSVPANTVTGVIGANVTPGTNLRMSWNAGTDWNNHAASQMRFRIKVSNLWDFSLIPGGNFTMGDTIDGVDTEMPHSVNVSPFYMQKKEVSKADWDEVRAWGLLHGYTDIAVGDGRAANHPVQNVTWFDVAKWCNARSEKENIMPCYYTDSAQTAVYRTGKTYPDNTMVKWTEIGYRLPTEAEWEKAARGGLSENRFPWGDTISHSEANFQNDGSESYQTGSIGYHPTYLNYISGPVTAPGGSFQANGYGLYDMAGNVSEWCWDWMSADYYLSSPTDDPHGSDYANDKAQRGGNYEF